MSNQPNTTQIYERTRQRWLSVNARRVSPQERFSIWLPFFLVVIQLAFFLLSASHTIEMINKISRNVGLAAAVGFELGLIVLSYMIYLAQKRGTQMPIWWGALEVLLFMLIVGANFGGSIAAVLEATSVKAFSASAIIAAYGSLPLNDQIALGLAVLFSISVPIGSLVVGQAVAHLLLDSEVQGSPIEARWERVAWKELYSAFYASGIDGGLDPRTAKLQAQRLASGFSGVSKPKELENSTVSKQLPAPFNESSNDSNLEFQTASNALQIAAENSKKPEFSIPVQSSKYTVGAYPAALDAYARGLSKQDVISQGIAKKSTAYRAWAEFTNQTNKDQGVSQ